MHIPLLPGWTPVPEDQVVDNLLQCSDTFRAYYAAERSKISRPVTWVKTADMPDGVNFGATRMYMPDTVHFFVILRSLPVLPAQAISVAHEIQHLVLDTEGFPALAATHGSAANKIAGVMGTMVQDPLVNARLGQFGFDIRAHYEREVDEDFEYFSRVSNAPTNKLDQLHWITIIVGKELDREVAGIRVEDDRFQPFVAARYPELVNKKRRMLKQVSTIGYETPRQMERLFRELIDEHKLSGSIKITKAI